MFGIHLPGRVENVRLPYRKALYPVFEAIVNSIHAIEAAGRREGHIDIEVVREANQGVLIEDVSVAPVASFAVTDDGVGFTDENYESFQTSDSRFKRAYGAKGVGRLLWLKAFSRTKVDSVFESDGKRFRRTFDFLLTPDGVENHTVGQANGARPQTTVHLQTFLPKYGEACPKKLGTIAAKVLDHCLIHLTQDGCPRIVVRDDREQFVLNDLYAERLARGSSRTTFTVKEKEFSILHLRIHSPEEPKHRLHFCAQKREVVEENLGTLVPDLQRKLTDEAGASFFLSSYVSGAVLDEAVNAERTEFTLPDAADLADDVSLGDIRTAAVASVREYVRPQLEDVSREKKDRIRQFVQTREPRYRALLQHHPETLDEIPPGLSDEKLDVALHTAKAKVEAQLRADCAAVLSGPPADRADVERIAGRFENLFEKVNAFGKAELADYIVHRKLILDLLQKRLELRADGKYSLEEAVHSVIFPLRTTSDDIDFEQQNLWVLDEKLAYHRYLASDKPLRATDEVLESASAKEPDLIIFDTPYAFTGERGPDFSAIVIVEFKRPSRDDYTDRKDPITQVYDYVEDIRSGRAKDAKGVPLTLPATIPIYGFVIADFTQSLQRAAKRASLVLSADGNRYFGYNPSHLVYLEVLSYTKLFADARQRNRILFDKLGLPK